MKFIMQDLDLVYNISGAKEYIHRGTFKKNVPLLEEDVKEYIQNGFQKDAMLLEEVFVMESIAHHHPRKARRDQQTYLRFHHQVLIFIPVSRAISLASNRTRTSSMFSPVPLVVFVIELMTNFYTFSTSSRLHEEVLIFTLFDATSLASYTTQTTCEFLCAPLVVCIMD
ncbi:hypothetical protein U1Q18_029970 [Sarracenia purpurea var. burkii]